MDTDREKEKCSQVFSVLIVIFVFFSFLILVFYFTFFCLGYGFFCIHDFEDEFTNSKMSDGRKDFSFTKVVVVFCEVGWLH